MADKKSNYIPDRGDIVWIDFDPTKGHEQKGNRPALVISPKTYNAKASLALLCPITHSQKGYPFEVSIQVKEVQGTILTDQIRSIDWNSRKVTKVGNAPMDTLQQVRDLLKVLIVD